MERDTYTKMDFLIDFHKRQNAYLYTRLMLWNEKILHALFLLEYAQYFVFFLWLWDVWIYLKRITIWSGIASKHWSIWGVLMQLSLHQTLRIYIWIYVELEENVHCTMFNCLKIAIITLMFNEELNFQKHSSWIINLIRASWCSQNDWRSKTIISFCMLDAWQMT